ncbi:hypothetical protein HDU92_002240 [Lobulomyces angularis]|nr:hypothetical protein HDU92_002240 [Lobulomyces angularis]
MVSEPTLLSSTVHLTSIIPVSENSKKNPSTKSDKTNSNYKRKSFNETFHFGSKKNNQTSLPPVPHLDKETIKQYSKSSHARSFSENEILNHSSGSEISSLTFFSHYPSLRKKSASENFHNFHNPFKEEVNLPPVPLAVKSVSSNSSSQNTLVDNEMYNMDKSCFSSPSSSSSSSIAEVGNLHFFSPLSNFNAESEEKVFNFENLKLNSPIFEKILPGKNKTKKRNILFKEKFDSNFIDFKIDFGSENLNLDFNFTLSDLKLNSGIQSDLKLNSGIQSDLKLNSGIQSKEDSVRNPIEINKNLVDCQVSESEIKKAKEITSTNQNVPEIKLDKTSDRSAIEDFILDYSEPYPCLVSPIRSPNTPDSPKYENMMECSLNGVNINQQSPSRTPTRQIEIQNASHSPPIFLPTPPSSRQRTNSSKSRNGVFGFLKRRSFIFSSSSIFHNNNKNENFENWDLDKEEVFEKRIGKMMNFEEMIRNEETTKVSLSNLDRKLEI